MPHNTFKCEYCKKFFTRNLGLKRHLETCKIKKNDVAFKQETATQLLIETLTNELSCKDKISVELKQKSTLIPNPILPYAFSPERVSQILSKELTVVNDIKIVFKQIVIDKDENILYKCTDPARQFFEFYQDENIIRDAYCVKLIEITSPLILKAFKIQVKNRELKHKNATLYDDDLYHPENESPKNPLVKIDLTEAKILKYMKSSKFIKYIVGLTC